ncbi:MAG TPA: RnfABCDGE type electron transport complex subunit D [Thermoanaerobaculia bacterium]|nr:RnfABCDGE type electron transport complex subunit D [Thermoanaerobaculia bacterium]
MTAEPVRIAPAPAPALHVAPGPHLTVSDFTARRMMADVLLALLPVAGVAVWIFRWYAVLQIAVCVAAALLAEALFSRLRRRRAPLDDLSAAVTGAILGLSLPWSAPWYVGAIGAFAAIGLGKAAFGGLGQNIFNPAMVGRAFVMVAFAASLAGGAYVRAEAALPILTQATPLSLAKGTAGAVALPGLWPLFLGNVNGSLGETSALACLVGGLYLCWRRSAAWQIPVWTLAGAAAAAVVANLLDPATPLTVLHHLFAGALFFCAFFIATDPVTSPLSPRGRAVFGFGVGVLVVLIRTLSSYPEGVVFAILLMNAVTPLINRGTVPKPFGGAVELPGGAK